MKTIRFLAVALSIVFLAIFAWNNPCSAKAMQSAEGWPAVMEDDSNAPGTKLYGTLTVYYSPTANEEEWGLYFFLRLSKGNKQYGFSGVADGSYIYTDWQNQKAAIKFFVENTVVPQLFGCAVSSCPAAVLKTVESYVNDDPSSFTPRCDSCFGPKFAMMDITIAVQ